jgi:redox-sensitive bicupin YhaK (pirin superfamily)
MIVLRPHNTRGNPKADWINSYRTFSFPGYFHPKYMNFGHLKTINDDRVQPNGHVPIHEHKNMEIFGYVVEGVCRHTDSHGNILDIPAGAVQRMSTGSGIKHTEGNASDTPNRYLQLWIRPNVLDTEPIHEWYQFTREDKLNKFCDVTEKLPIKQDARLLCGIFTEDYTFEINLNRKYYLYVILGVLTVNDFSLIEGDGLSFVEENEIKISLTEESEIILFDLL